MVSRVSSEKVEERLISSEQVLTPCLPFCFDLYYWTMLDYKFKLHDFYFVILQSVTNINRSNYSVILNFYCRVLSFVFRLVLGSGGKANLEFSQPHLEGGEDYNSNLLHIEKITPETLFR